MEKASTSNIIHPPEVWRIILGNLKNNPSALLKLRFVSKTIKSIADELLKKNFSMWSPSFYQSGREIADCRSGPILSTALDIDIFLIQFVGGEGRPWNPIPNGALKFIPHQTLDKERRKLFYDKFPALLDEFQEDIHHLNYTLNEDHEGGGELLELVNIFKLKNLKSLVLSRQHWCSRKTVAGVDWKLLKAKLAEIEFPSKFEELQILGSDSWFPLFPILIPLLKGLKSLSCSWQTPLTGMTTSLEEDLTGDGKFNEYQLPKLTKLKLVFPTKVSMEHFIKAKARTNFAPKISQICLSFPFHDEWSNKPPGLIRNTFEPVICDVIRALDYQAEFVEVLHLNIALKMLESLENRNVDLNWDLNSDVKFVKLKHFIVNFHVIILGRLLLSELKGKMGYLEKVTLILNHSDVGSSTAKEIYDCVKSAWNLFPDCLKVIDVPYFGWRLGRGDEMSFDICL